MDEKTEISLCDSLMTPHCLIDDQWRLTGTPIEPRRVKWKYLGGSQDCAAQPLQIPIEEQEITVFTDKDLFSPTVDAIKSKFKVGFLNECEEIHPWAYKDISMVEHKFDFIITHNEDLAKREKFINYVGPGTTWITDEKALVYDKTKLLSHIASKQNWAKGHRLRHVITECIKGKYEVDLWGSAHRGFEKSEKFLPLKEYCFSITVMNADHKDYFTETLVDAFRCGTVPIFWGCKNVEDFFNEKGILRFNNPSELKKILDNLSMEQYHEMLPYVKENFELAKNYIYLDDTVHDIIIKAINGESHV